MADGENVTEKFNFLETTKMLLGIQDTNEDKVLQLYINIITQSILDYCNISVLPSALFYNVCEMTVDTYRENNMKKETGSVVGSVSSISEDGRTVSFSNGSELKATIDNRISKLTELNRYKKLYRV